MKLPYCNPPQGNAPYLFGLILSYFFALPFSCCPLFQSLRPDDYIHEVIAHFHLFIFRNSFLFRSLGSAQTRLENLEEIVSRILKKKLQEKVKNS